MSICTGAKVGHAFKDGNQLKNNRQGVFRARSTLRTLDNLAWLIRVDPGYREEY